MMSLLGNVFLIPFGLTLTCTMVFKLLVTICGVKPEIGNPGVAALSCVLFLFLAFCGARVLTEQEEG